MKIECDKCGAKYSIADDKVRGKTFKIRCKKCSNVIIVREKEGGAADAGAAEGDSGGGEEGGWHLAIDGETVGPISEQEVRDRFAAGEIDKDTSIWQEGFEDWLPLGEVETFSDLVGSLSAGLGAVGASAATVAEDPFASAGSDDYGSPGLKHVLESRLAALRWLRFLIRYRELHILGDRASVDIRYDISFQLLTEVGEKWERRQNEKRLELKHEGNRWMFLSGY